MEDQVGTSPARKTPIEKDLDQSLIRSTTTTTIVDRNEARDQTLEFIKYESEHSSQVIGAALGQKETEKVSHFSYNLEVLRPTKYVRENYKFIYIIGIA